MVSNLAKATVALAVSCFCVGAHATMLDWSTVSWAPGSLGNSYDIDPNNPGNDISIVFSGDTFDLRDDGGAGVASPDISQTLHGGQTPVKPSLYWETILATSNNSITITISFSPGYLTGVENVSFTLFDIDRKTPNKQDQIGSIFALATDGITQIAPTISNLGANVSLTGTGLDQVLIGNWAVPSTGPDSGDGNATISFNASNIQSVSFTFGNPYFAQSPNSQFVSLFNISYVPEAGTGWVTVIICATAVGLSSWQRARSSRSRGVRP